MGNKPGASVSEEDLMAITAMAHVVKFDKREVAQFQQAVEESMEEDTVTTITKDQFQSLIADIKLRKSDREILDRMYILFDETGDAIIDIKDYITGIRLLCKGSLEEHLTFAFKLYDMDESGNITTANAQKAMTAMNNTIGWFGDKNMNEGELKTFLDEVTGETFCNEEGDFEYIQFIPKLVKMPALITLLKLEVKEEDDG